MVPKSPCSICPMALCWSWVPSVWGWPLCRDSDPLLILAGKVFGNADPGRGLCWLNGDCAGRKCPTYGDAERSGDTGDSVGQRRQLREDFTLMVPPKGCHAPINTAVQLSETLHSLLIYSQDPFPPTKEALTLAFHKAKVPEAKP